MHTRYRYTQAPRKQNKTPKSRTFYLSLALLITRKVIKSFNCKETEKIWNGNRSKKFPIQIQNVARRKLRMINNSININDLRIPPANRLEKLKGDLKGYHSIRINEKYRIIFKWRANHAYELQIIDYHD